MTLRNGAFFLAGLVILTLPILVAAEVPAAPRNDLTYSELLERIDKGEIDELVIQGSEVSAWGRDRTVTHTILPAPSPVLEMALTKGVQVKARMPPNDSDFSIVSVFLSWVPMLVFFGVLWLFIGRPLYAMGVKLDRITAMLDRGND